MNTVASPAASPLASSSASADNQAFKAGMRKQWDVSAQGWNHHTAAIRAWLRQSTDAMLDMAGIGPGASVLDVAAGAGDQTLDIAQRVVPTGRVLATDLSPVILELARSKQACATCRPWWPTARTWPWRRPASMQQ
jgi:cyclopropane fatty-acyl-phospholipid synthase-like methyltransferase